MGGVGLSVAAVSTHDEEATAVPFSYYVIPTAACPSHWLSTKLFVENIVLGYLAYLNYTYMSCTKELPAESVGSGERVGVIERDKGAHMFAPETHTMNK